MRKRKSAGFGRKVIIAATIITAFSILGVSYASWNSSLSMGTTVFSGKVDTYFYNSQEDTWNTVIKNSTAGNLINNCNELKGTAGQDRYTLNINGGQIRTEKSVFILYRVINDGTIPVKLEEGNILVNGNKSIVQAPMEIGNVTNAGNNMHVSLGREAYTDINGLQVNLYSPIQDILQGKDQYNGWGILIVRASQSGNYKLKVELPFGLWNNPGSIEWKKTLTINLEFTAVSQKDNGSPASGTGQGTQNSEEGESYEK